MPENAYPLRFPLSVPELKALAHDIRKDILDLALHAGKKGAHIGGALSCADILATLYGAVLRVNPALPEDINRDRFILSKGHCSMALYAALYERGFMTHDELFTFEENGSFLPGHSVMNRAKGIELSSGSLGLGLSFGIGQALSAKQKSLAYMTYVLLGNGECNEGSVWEAVMFAPQHNLDNLVAILDDNQLQLDGPSDAILNLSDIEQTFKSFGWNVLTIDGHDVQQILSALQTAQIFQGNGKPIFIHARTIKGKGCSFMEQKTEWHHKALSQEQYEFAVKELEDNGF